MELVHCQILPQGDIIVFEKVIVKKEFRICVLSVGGLRFCISEGGGEMGSEIVKEISSATVTICLASTAPQDLEALGLNVRGLS